MPFTAPDFRNLFGSDVWVLEQMLTVPSDPEPVITNDNGNIHIELFDTVAMPQMQEAVLTYRRNLLPVIFFVSQKVYAEFFRLALWANGQDAGWKQVEVENGLKPLIAAGTLTSFLPFADRANFQDWWAGKYNYSELREARNQIAHKDYTLSGNRIVVPDRRGGNCLNWTDTDVFNFSEEVLAIANTV